METELATWMNGITLHRIHDPHARYILDYIAHLTGTSSKSRKPSVPFPGPNPVSIERADYPKLRAQSYHITEKTDGIRAIMTIGEISGLNVIAVIDRTMTPYLFPIEYMPKALYQGSLFDGEVVYDKLEQRWVFLIFDAINVSGVPVFHLPFTERLGAIAASLHFYKPSEQDPGLLRVKAFLPFVKEVEMAFQAHVETVRQRYDTDGIIFMPHFDRVVYGRHDNLFKLKTKHSIDFLVRNGKLHIYDEHVKRNKPIGTPTGPNAADAKDGVIVECTLDPESKKHELWKVVGVRHDKTTSNNKLTFERTLVNIREALTLRDVLQGTFEVSLAGNPLWN